MLDTWVLLPGLEPDNRKLPLLPVLFMYISNSPDQNHNQMGPNAHAYLFVVQLGQASREAAHQLYFVLNLHRVMSPSALLYDVHLQ